MGRDEQQKLLASGPVQGEAMSGTDSADTAPVAPFPCDYCSGMPAAVYCRADSARLCLPCDRHVHGANTVSSSHGRAPLCAVCLAAAAAFRCAALFLCSNCEFEKHRDDHAQGVPLHDRRTVEGYTGCPSVSELAAILGVDVECDKAANEGWWPVWEVPQVLSLDDVIVPTTSCHGFQPLLMPSSPKNRSSPGGELNEEVLRQLGELAKSEAAAYEEAEPAGDQLPSWASSEYAIGHGDFGAFGTETSHEAASMAAPSCEHEAWIAIDCNDPTDACEAEVLSEQVPVSSAAEPCLSSFVQISEICPSMSRSSSIDNSSQDPATVDVPTQALPKKGGYDISYPDRGTVISRYREKRKNRRFGKQIRYESRKARADGRLRIKGRFAKSN